eukprot:5022598-Pyramimonas_sp.AAC.1
MRSQKSASRPWWSGHPIWRLPTSMAAGRRMTRLAHENGCRAPTSSRDRLPCRLSSRWSSRMPRC